MVVRKRRNSKFFFAGLLGIFGITIFITITPPISPVLISIFFIGLTITIYLLAYYALYNVRRSIFVTLFFTVTILLRAVHLREPIYPTLLGASLISLEVFLGKR